MALWSAALDTLAGRTSPRTRAALAAATAPLELLPTTFRVAARASGVRTSLGSGAIALLRRAIERLTDSAQALALAPVPDAAELSRDPRLDFSSFIVSPTNAAARDRTRALAEGRNAVPPLMVLHGPPGGGKTHLLRSAAAALRNRLPHEVLSLSADALALLLVEALWKDDLAAFRARLARASALVIDDLEALHGREATQEELVLAIDAALARNAPVLISSAHPPIQMNQIVPALAVRLRTAEPLELEAPGWETRVAIVLDRVRTWGVRATPEIASYLAARLRSDLDRLDVVLTTLMAESATGAGLEDLALVQQILEADSRTEQRPSALQVIELVARHFALRPRELSSRGRSQRTATPRQIAMYLLRRHCGLSYPEVGRHFRRHHTTVLHADRLMQRQIQADAGLRSSVVLLEKELRTLAQRGR